MHCLWEDGKLRERTGHPPSYAEAKKMKSQTLHTRGCPRASLRDCSSSILWRSLSLRFLLYRQSWLWAPLSRYLAYQHITLHYITVTQGTVHNSTVPWVIKRCGLRNCGCAEGCMVAFLFKISSTTRKTQWRTTSGNPFHPKIVNPIYQKWLTSTVSCRGFDTTCSSTDFGWERIFVIARELGPSFTSNAFARYPE